MSNRIEDLHARETDAIDQQAREAERAAIESRIREAQQVTDQARDVQLVELSHINPNDVKSQADFKSPEHYASLHRGAEMLKQILPALEKGADPDYFHEWDEVNHMGQYTPEGHVWGYADTYKSYFDTDRIGLDPKPDGTFDALGGQHRIFVAREVGLTKIPAQIVR